MVSFKVSLNNPLINHLPLKKENHLPTKTSMTLASNAVNFSGCVCGNKKNNQLKVENLQEPVTYLEVSMGVVTGPEARE